MFLAGEPMVETHQIEEQVVEAAEEDPEAEGNQARNDRAVDVVEGSHRK